MSPAKPATPAQWLTDEGVEKIICETLRVHGMPAQEIEDARQDVYVKVLVALKQKAAPADLEEMKNLCVRVAHLHAISALRKTAVRARDMVAECEPDELAPLAPAVKQRDPVDAGRQLEVLAQLFRDDQMPADGVDILEGVACGCTWAEIAAPLDITEDLAETRYRRMKASYRRRMAKLGRLPDMTPVRLLVSNPGAIERLRGAA
jgi:DNA-directed RNA polymerase specialized sigma24 family protein